MKDSKSLLFVDDEEEILEILVDLFTDEGYQLHTATSAIQAKKIIDRHPVDFILSDLRLPDGSGSELLNHIQEKHPKTVRVLTSGYMDLQFGRVAVDRKNGTFYVSKPWDLMTLKQLVSDQLGQ
ncbi:response regulator [bacterium]|nr:response regulator [bacterium]